MSNQKKTQKQLLYDFKQCENNIQKLRNAKKNQNKVVEALNLGNDLYADLANSLPSGMYRTRVFHDLALNEEGWLGSREVPYVVEFANDRFFEILHLDRVVFEKNPGIINDLIYYEDKAEFARLNIEANLNFTPFFWEGRFLVNDSIIWINFKSIPRILENQDIIWTGTLDDISSRKQAEEEIKNKNAELQKLNADKDYFISILGHDLKSPFNSILGFLDMLLSDLHTNDIDETERQLKIVNNSAIFAYKLLEDILAWALSQSGKLPFEPKEHNLKFCCDKVVEMLKPNAENKNISIDNAMPEEIMVFADANMLNCILRNLISNAIKFTSNGCYINIYSEQNNSEITISVFDNGIGISPEILSKLFDNTQINSLKGTANEKGTGLGLLLCKKFVEKHGGKIWAESKLGQESIFKFTLPFNKELSGDIKKDCC
jgi:signal transduction histidine kinase